MFSSLMVYALASNFIIIFYTLYHTCSPTEKYDVRNDEFVYRCGFLALAINTCIVFVLALVGWNF